MPRARTTKTTAKKSNGNTRKKTGARRTKATTTKATTVPIELRHQMIQETAYLKAEEHGFHTDPHADWFAAEAEVDARLTGRA